MATTLPSNRSQLVHLTPELLAHLLAPLGLPADAEVRGLGYDFETNTYRVVVTSGEFPPVPPGQQLPRFDPPGLAPFYVVGAVG